MNYYISDLHFCHANIIRFDERPFKNTFEMEQTIINNWNNKITKDDMVYILGDFCWGKEDDWLRILDQLNGAKVLIRGNHDLKHPTAKLKSKFRKICDYEEIKDNGRTIIMSHYPILFFNHSGNRNAWHFCGHTHNRTSEEFKRQEYVWDLIKSRKEDYENKGHIINVGCMMDYINYTPQTSDELIDWWQKYYEIN